MKNGGETLDKNLTLYYTVKPISFEKINDEFTKLRCYIMALGKNRNYSYFSKEAVEAALPTLFNIPVVAHIKKADDGHWYVGSHDRQIVIDDSGISVNDLTIPYGVVAESCNPEFVEITESNGIKATYLVADIILWTGRYPNILEAKSQDENILFNQSMEIGISGWKLLEEDKSYSDIFDFGFSALCLLGRDLENPEYHSEPCFPSASVVPTEFNIGDKFKQEFEIMKYELKKLNLNQSSHYEVDIKQNNQNGEGEKKPLDEKLELLAKYNLAVDTIDFNIDEMSFEDLEVKLKEEYEQKDNTDGDVKVSFSATYRQ